MTYDKENYWYGWNGGECPVHPETEVEVIYRGRSPEVGPAGHEDWTHDDHPGDIIAFNIRKLYREPRKAREWWVNMYPDGSAAMVDSKQRAVSINYSGAEIVHVREVLGDDDAH